MLIMDSQTRILRAVIAPLPSSRPTGEARPTGHADSVYVRQRTEGTSHFHYLASIALPIHEFVARGRTRTEQVSGDPLMNSNPVEAAK